MRLVEGGEQDRAQHIVSHGFFKNGKIADICLRHLKADGALDIRQLVEKRKGIWVWSAGDGLILRVANCRSQYR